MRRGSVCYLMTDCSGGPEDWGTIESMVLAMSQDPDKGQGRRLYKAFAHLFACFFGVVVVVGAV